MRKWFELWGETLYAFDLPNRFSRTCTTVRHDRTLAYLGDCLASKLLYSIDLGSIIITENTAVRPDAFIFSSKLCLEISKPMVSYFLCAADEKDKESWLDAIGEAIQRKKGVLFSIDLISFCLFVCCLSLYIAFIFTLLAVDIKAKARTSRMVFLLALDKSTAHPSRLAFLPLDLLAMIVDRLLPEQCSLGGLVGKRRAELVRMFESAPSQRAGLRAARPLRCIKWHAAAPPLKPLDAPQRRKKTTAPAKTSGE